MRKWVAKHNRLPRRRPAAPQVCLAAAPPQQQTAPAIPPTQRAGGQLPYVYQLRAANCSRNPPSQRKPHSAIPHAPSNANPIHPGSAPGHRPATVPAGRRGNGSADVARLQAVHHEPGLSAVGKARAIRQPDGVAREPSRCCLLNAACAAARLNYIVRGHCEPAALGAGCNRQRSSGAEPGAVGIEPKLNARQTETGGLGRWLSRPCGHIHRHSGSPIRHSGLRRNLCLPAPLQ